MGFVIAGHESDTAIVSNVLRGRHRRRSAGLLDSRPDDAEMTRQMEVLDRRAGGLVYNLGRIHRHPGQMTELSGTDTASYEILCRQGGLAGILCPIMTVAVDNARRIVNVTGHVYVAGDGPIHAAVQVMTLPEFGETWTNASPKLQAAAARVAATSNWDVADILRRAAESGSPASHVSFATIAPDDESGSGGALSSTKYAVAVHPAQADPIPLPFPDPTFADACSVSTRTLGFLSSLVPRFAFNRQIAGRWIFHATTLGALVVALCLIWDLRSRVSTLTESGARAKIPEQPAGDAIARVPSGPNTAQPQGEIAFSEMNRRVTHVATQPAAAKPEQIGEPGWRTPASMPAGMDSGRLK